MGNHLPQLPQLPQLSLPQFLRRNNNSSDADEKLLQTQIAWCSYESNIISLSDLAGNAMTTFEGVQLSGGGLHTYVEYVPETDYLLSVNHNNSTVQANFEVYSTYNSKRIFSFGEIQGNQFDISWGDVAFDPNRKFAALLSVQNLAEYHLFDCSADVTLVKRARWVPEHEGYITSLSFDPEGQKIATLDYCGGLAITDVNTSDLLCYQSLEPRWCKARWNPIKTKPCIAVNYNHETLSLIDAEKQKAIFRLETDAVSLDWRNDGNILICGGSHEPGKNVTLKVYDTRKRKAVKTYENRHQNQILSMRWNSDGSLLATASADGTVKVAEFASDKILFEGKTPDGKAANSVCFIEA